MIRSLTSIALYCACAFAAAAAGENPPADDIYTPGRALVADIDRIVTPNGVDETFEVELGGARQLVNVRGADRANPILLFVHGGPAAVEIPVASAFQRPWEDFFTVVEWDQRGAGRSFLLNDPEALAPTLKPERYRDDAIELIELLRRKYNKRKVFLLGHSWGSVVSLSVAAKRPDLLYAYIGMGQVIDFPCGSSGNPSFQNFGAPLAPHLQQQSRSPTSYSSQSRQILSSSSAPRLSLAVRPLSSPAMQRDYHRWYSHRLNRDMGVVIYGHYGMPILAFPTSGGDEWEQEGQGMIRTLSPYVDEGRIRIFSINGVNNDTFQNKSAHPFHRSWLLAQYAAYVANEVFPFIDSQCQTPGIPIATLGASLGAFHAANILFKHPDRVKRCYALSGVYDMRDSMDGMYDDNFYFNNPVDYLANQNDPWFLHQYTTCDIRLTTGTGAWEVPGPTYQMSAVLASRGIAHHLDDWGPKGGHDWPYWHHQMWEYVGAHF